MKYKLLIPLVISCLASLPIRASADESVKELLRRGDSLSCENWCLIVTTDLQMVDIIQSTVLSGYLYIWSEYGPSWFSQDYRKLTPDSVLNAIGGILDTIPIHIGKFRDGRRCSKTVTSELEGAYLDQKEMFNLIQRPRGNLITFSQEVSRLRSSYDRHVTAVEMYNKTD
jgi:hypothetical protein